MQHRSASLNAMPTLLRDVGCK